MLQEFSAGDMGDTAVRVEEHISSLLLVKPEGGPGPGEAKGDADPATITLGRLTIRTLKPLHISRTHTKPMSYVGELGNRRPSQNVVEVEDNLVIREQLDAIPEDWIDEVEVQSKYSRQRTSGPPGDRHLVRRAVTIEDITGEETAFPEQHVEPIIDEDVEVEKENRQRSRIVIEELLDEVAEDTLNEDMEMIQCLSNHAKKNFMTSADKADFNDSIEPPRASPDQAAEPPCRGPAHGRGREENESDACSSQQGRPVCVTHAQVRSLQ
jgi:hypothetical protein